MKFKFNEENLSITLDEYVMLFDKLNESQKLKLQEKCSDLAQLDLNEE